MRTPAFKQNLAWLGALLTAHKCVLWLSKYPIGAQVKRLQIREHTPVIEIDTGKCLLEQHTLDVTNENKNGVHYQRTEYLGCVVVWQQQEQAEHE